MLLDTNIVIFTHSMVRIQDRISQGLQVLQYFTMRPWNFPSQNYDAICEILNKEEREVFRTNVKNEDRYKYMSQGVEGGRIFCLKEDPTKVPLNKMYNNL